MGFYFYPRGGSAHACRAIAGELRRNGVDVTVIAGSRSDIGAHGSARNFFGDCDLHPVDFTPALASGDPLGFDGPPGTAPMHASYEDRPGAEDPVMAALGGDLYAHQVDSWSRELTRAAQAGVDLLYIHHLSPLNEAAARVLPDVPVIGHIHGSELLMLERIAHGIPAGWAAASSWAERLSDWAAGCARIVVNSPNGMRRASTILDIHPDRFVTVPNGFKANFTPRDIDRAEHWRRQLVARPQGWGPGQRPGSVSYAEADLRALTGTVLLSIGRFTEVKRLPLLIESFASAQPRFEDRTALVLLGGFPGEWEGEHPRDVIERVGADNVFLAGWHSHAELPDFLNASDAVVHPSAHEQFGQVLVEGMACGLPAIAVDRGGPADILDDGETGWLIEPDDGPALVDAMVAAVNRPLVRRRLGAAARQEAIRSYAWETVGTELADVVRDTADLRRGDSQDAGQRALVPGAVRRHVPG